MDASKKQQIEHNFTYHPPVPSAQPRFAQIRDKGKELALLIAEITPVSREQSLALTKLEEATMWANAAIARYQEERTPAAEPGGWAIVGEPGPELVHFPNGAQVMLLPYLKKAVVGAIEDAVRRRGVDFVNGEKKVVPTPEDNEHEI